MPKIKVRFTYEDYLQLPGDKRYELMEGEFYMVPSPNVWHQTLLERIFLALHHYVTNQRLGELHLAPLDVVLSEENVVQPDILFISEEHSHIITERNIQGAPDLVIEVLSPSTGERDRGLKRKLYAKYGVGEYWIVSPEEQGIEVMRLGETGFETVGVHRKGETLTSPLLKGFRLDLDEIF